MVFADDHKAVRLFVEMLHVGSYMTGGHQEQVWIVPHALIRGEEHGDLLCARCVCAFADKVGCSPAFELVV
jgi:hypothetical protein